MDPKFQFQMAYIDWEKYSGPFHKLSQYPDNWASCVFTMCNDFSQKDLLRAVPQNGPWSLINEIKSARPLAEAKVRGQTVNPAAIARVTACCHDFTRWADSYFVSTTPPWERGKEATQTGGSGGMGCGGCLAVVLIGIFVIGMVILLSK